MSSTRKQSVLKTSSPEELSSTETLEQIRIKSTKDLWEVLSREMEEFRKVGADVSYFQSQMHSEYDSAESIADSDLEDGERRKMLASPLYLQNREDCESS